MTIRSASSDCLQPERRANYAKCFCVILFHGDSGSLRPMDLRVRRSLTTPVQRCEWHEKYVVAQASPILQSPSVLFSHAPIGPVGQVSTLGSFNTLVTNRSVSSSASYFITYLRSRAHALATARDPDGGPRKPSDPDLGAQYKIARSRHLASRASSANAEESSRRCAGGMPTRKNTRASRHAACEFLASHQWA